MLVKIKRRRGCKVWVLSPQQAQLRRFLAVLFEPDDLIEVRPIETWEQDGKKRSRLIGGERAWLTRTEVLRRCGRLERLTHTQHANIFFGTCPRPAPGKGKAEHIKIVRVLWSDVDGCTPKEALNRVREVGLPDPTVIVNSGHGVHLYWKLDRPAVVRTGKDRAQIASLMQRINEIIGGDHTQDLSRILRLPGFDNVKNARNGADPTPCRVHQPGNDSLVPMGSFKRALPTAESRPCSGTQTASISPLDGRDLAAWAVEALKAEPKDGDRSARDFHVLCRLAEGGWTAERAWKLVRPYSKLAQRGRRYFNTTWAKAVKSARSAPVLNPKDPLSIAERYTQDNHALEGERLLHHHGGDFWRFDGSCYERVKNGALRADLYRYLRRARRVVKEGGAAAFQPTKTSVDFVLDALRGHTHLGDSMVPPVWIDGREFPRLEYVVCRNGLLHLPTMKLTDPTPELFATSTMAVEYDPNAPKPKRWLRFLRSLWPDDPDTIETLQMMFGHVLTPDTRHQKIFMLVGPKRSGKGTIARVLAAMLGRDAVASPTASSFDSQFGLAGLVGRLLAIISDAWFSSKRSHMAVERLLTISGEDRTTIERKYIDAWEGRLTTRFLIITNELPSLLDSSGALAHRFIVMQLTQSWLGREDHDLEAKLLEELPGIFRWAVRGWHKLQERGRFMQPGSSAEAIQQMEYLASPVKAFVDERCEIGPGHRVEASKLYGAYVAWCTEQGDRMSPKSKDWFGRDLNSAAPGLKKSRRRDGQKRLWVYEGIGLRKVK